ncbi:MAG: hypothetical protein LAT62_12060 [Natronospirillum sp.]|uniref:replication protein P n=1 Tax=Natronospirillum sp. TaxID=2812955 RepID=UPI0025E356E5|nr:replication protein P [Natronospirillum sp.]MCH8552666.1 hypothetical protein [Natronospirillum sp.]
MVNMLFARFHHIYTHKFESAYADDDTLTHAKREWAMALQAFPLEAIEKTIDAVRLRHAWPPTIAEFLNTLSDVARPEGLPDARDAYQEACMHAGRPLQHHWRHAAVYQAASRTGFFRLRSEPEHHVWPDFQRYYQELALSLCQGHELAEPEQPALPTPPDTGPPFDLAAWCRQHGVDQGQIAHLFHYLELPAGSTVRHNFRARTLQALEKQNLPNKDLPT